MINYLNERLLKHFVDINVKEQEFYLQQVISLPLFTLCRLFWPEFANDDRRIS